MRGLLGDRAEELERSLAEPPAAGLRVNTSKLSPSEFERLSPWPLEPVPWCPAGFVLRGLDYDPKDQERPGLHPFHAAGLYYLQEPSAMAAAEALAPHPGESVLDLAAAPGGKSTHLASLLADSGLLVANDVDTARARELSRNLERWGSRRTLITSAAPESLARAWGARFDAVLLDAPCSGEGMFRKSAEALAQWTPELVTACASRQDALLAQAARLVKPGGRLVYSTCTFEPEENERVVACFLDENPNWELGPIDLAGVERARPEWRGSAGSRRDLSRAVRLWPDRSQGEGHFVALLHRSSTDQPERSALLGDRRRKRERPGRSEGNEHQAIASWSIFVREELTADPFTGHELSLRSDGLYALPPGSPPLDGLRVLRPGLWLGSLTRSRFQPSHALALALREGEANRSLELGPRDSRLYAYLAGAELEDPGEDGWLLVTVAGQPLGWGRRARNIVKNHYPKGLRRSTG